MGSFSRSSRAVSTAAAAVDDHVVVVLDDNSDVDHVHDSQGLQVCGHAAGLGDDGGHGVDQGLYDGVVRRIPRVHDGPGTAAVAVVRVETRGGQNPVAPVELVEVDVKRMSTAELTSALLHQASADHPFAGPPRSGRVARWRVHAPFVPRVGMAMGVVAFGSFAGRIVHTTDYEHGLFIRGQKGVRRDHHTTRKSELET